MPNSTRTHWYAYDPARLGGRLIAKFEASEAQVRHAFGDCARIGNDGTVRFFRRPSLARAREAMTLRA